MDTVKLGNSKLLHLVFKPAGIMMGSLLRKWLMNPVKTLKIANVQSNMLPNTVLSKRRYPDKIYASLQFSQYCGRSASGQVTWTR